MADCHRILPDNALLVVAQNAGTLNGLLTTTQDSRTAELDESLPVLQVDPRAYRQTHNATVLLERDVASGATPWCES